MAALSVTAANVIPSTGAALEQCISGTTITAGQPVFVVAGVAQLSDSDATAPGNTVTGIAVSGASLNQPLIFVRKDPNFTPGFTALAGDTIWLFDAAGGVTKTFADLETGDTVIALGVMLTTTTMNLNPTTGGAIA